LLVDAATNRISTGGYTYDANGNLTAMPFFLTGLTYDVENRMTQATHTLNGTEQYGYSPDNKRIWKKKPDGSEEIYFYGVDRRKLGSYQPSYPQFTLISKNVYFAGKLIQSQGGAVMVDRLGSVRVGAPGGSTNSRYYEYGEEQSATPNDREKFGTYFRDGTTALDYADQRYYASTLGRFLTPDPYRPVQWRAFWEVGTATCMWRTTL